MATDDFFRARLDQMIDLRHPLPVLASRMPWSDIEAALAPAFAHRDRKGRSRVLTYFVRRWPWPVQESATSAGRDCRSA